MNISIKQIVGYMLILFCLLSAASAYELERIAHD